MKSIPSLLRIEEDKVLAGLTLNGSIVDIGGDKNSKYASVIKGSHTITTINLNDKVAPDIFHDLEKSLPCKDAQYDHAILINVLEHIFAYKELLKESVRIIKPKGMLVIVVPFLFPVHPSPLDFRRFTQMTLKAELELLSLKNIKIKSLGTGVFSAQYLFIDRLMPWPIRFINFYTGRYITYLLDSLFNVVSKILRKQYSTEDYALGYYVTAQK
ncbi:MAG: methyltransferase domain-containing protein [Patescibacteria group bacterium]